MSEEVDRNRRRFVMSAALSIAAAELGTPAQGESRKGGFASLEQIDAGLLSVGYAEAGPYPDPGAYAKRFVGPYAHRSVKGGLGHNLPQEAPQAFADAIRDAYPL